MNPPNKDKLKIDFRIWIFNNGEKLFGKGRVELLEKINKSGSIANAAKEMNMSYRQAWQMVNEMNKRSNHPLVEKQLGGKNGGGAILTQAGKSAINKFNELEKRINAVIVEETKKLEL
ncbi:MAG: LysR family transcriptional regulator [Bacteroidia bacterium]|nr:LysR family transcriptional regulator [Bacteroidia bacterium]